MEKVGSLLPRGLRVKPSPLRRSGPAHSKASHSWRGSQEDVHRPEGANFLTC